MSKVGRKTPVWRNKRTGRVVCGTTVQDALGVGWMCPVGEDWERVSSLPPEHRVVINDGSVLPENDIRPRQLVCLRSKHMGASILFMSGIWIW